jgi:hypothetical protein
MKDFNVTYGAEAGDFRIWLLRKTKNGRGAVWWIDKVEKDQQSRVFSAVLDIISQADAQSDFTQAEKLIASKFNDLCASLGLSSSPQDSE